MPDSKVFSVCVYCASRPGHSAEAQAAAAAVGQHIGQQGWQLVYGGGRSGLMGIVAQAALDAGARVVGVIPRSLMEREHGHTGLHDLLVVETMHERKRLMAEHSHAFMALPGGIGTLEELFETWTWRQLGFHDKPVGLLNIAGFYVPLLSFLNRTVLSGYLTADQLSLVQVGDDPVELLQRLHRSTQHAQAKQADYRGI